MRLRALAPGKINLGLCLGPTRADGRHELVTLLESLSLADELVLETLESAVRSAAARDEVVCPGVEGENVVARALAGLRERGWDGPRVRIVVDKRIPVAAGMGGGSADAAATLRMAVELAPGRPEEVMTLAAALGADVPSQVVPGLVLGTGAGDLTEPFEPLAPHGVLIVPLPVPLSTAHVYREADRLGLSRGGDELYADYEAYVAALHAGARLPDGLIVNDLEAAARSLCPEIDDALAAARASGADNVLVSGSGPTVAGLFWGPDGPDRASAAAGEVSVRFPDATSAIPVSAEFGLPQFA
jgi:4-diphosphocytidyl-2-C-methyl-D-erythritol kinase